MKRFINEDAILDISTAFTDMNLFAYCGNDPVNRYDITGTAWIYNGIEYKYDGSIADFHRAENGLSPLAYEAAVAAASLSPWGEPNTHVDDYSDGYRKERWYGDDGRATKDRHHTDHSDPKHHSNPHDQDWDWSDPEHPKLGNPYPSPEEISINWESIIGVGMVCVAVVGIVWVTANDVTGVGIADDSAIIPLFGLLTNGTQMITR